MNKKLMHAWLVASGADCSGPRCRAKSAAAPASRSTGLDETHREFQVFVGFECRRRNDDQTR